MKKALLMILLPLLTLAIVITTGFSIWYFGTNTESTGSLNVEVENKVGIGDLTVSHNKFSLFFHKPSKYAGSDGINIVEYISDNNNNNKLNPTPINIISTYTHKDINTKDDVLFTCTISVPQSMNAFMILNPKTDFFVSSVEGAEVFTIKKVMRINSYDLVQNKDYSLTVPSDIFIWDYKMIPNGMNNYNFLKLVSSMLNVTMNFKVEYINNSTNSININ